MNVQFERSQYSAQESVPSTELCILVQGSQQRDVSLGIIDLTQQSIANNQFPGDDNY